MSCGDVNSDEKKMMKRSVREHRNENYTQKTENSFINRSFPRHKQTETNPIILVESNSKHKQKAMEPIKNACMICKRKE